MRNIGSLTDVLGEEYVREALRQFADTAFCGRMVTLYDPYGRPVYVPSTESRIGTTINVKTPARFSTSKTASKPFAP